MQVAKFSCVQEIYPGLMLHAFGQRRIEFRHEKAFGYYANGKAPAFGLVRGWKDASSLLNVPGDLIARHRLIAKLLPDSSVFVGVMQSQVFCVNNVGMLGVGQGRLVFLGHMIEKNILTYFFDEINPQRTRCTDFTALFDPRNVPFVVN